jgi:hypothetical protein
MRVDRRISVDPATLTADGTSASLVALRVLSASSAPIVLTPGEAELTYTPLLASYQITCHGQAIAIAPGVVAMTVRRPRSPIYVNSRKSATGQGYIFRGRTR